MAYIETENETRTVIRNTSDIVVDYHFDKQDKATEIELIDSNIKTIKQQLVSGAATLKASTIAQLMNMLEELTLKKDFLENGTTSNEPDIDAAWGLHRKAQSGFELKAKKHLSL